jgi:glutamine amidotransferase
MKVGIVDYGMGNLASVEQAVTSLGHTPAIIANPESLRECDRVILPGVGAFAQGMDRLEAGGWVEPIRNVVAGGKPLLGICLGMQFLAARGTEGTDRAGLGLIDGTVVGLRVLGCNERVPHAGWNETRITADDILFEGLPRVADYYYVHSYAFAPANREQIIATVEHGCEITAAVRSARVWGTQFHPEKSSKAGLALLKNFIELGEC